MNIFSYTQEEFYIDSFCGCCLFISFAHLSLQINVKILMKWRTLKKKKRKKIPEKDGQKKRTDNIHKKNQYKIPLEYMKRCSWH